MRTCHYCHTEIPDYPEPCAPCVAAWPDKPAGNVMSVEARLAEMELYRGPLEVPFPLLHERIESLVGRPVWTHEMGMNWDGLVEEARTQPGLDQDKVISDLVAWGKANGKPVLVIQE